MSLHLHLPESRPETLRPTITVIGVGGAGGNAVNNMIASGLEGVRFVVANTDAQSLDHALAEKRIQLGATITRGLGAGASPDVGRAAAEEAIDEIEQSLAGSNMVFITAGMGGGTGTGAAPVVARVARELGVLTVGVVTKPFQFEGTHRMRLADGGIQELQQYVDTLIVIPNQNLFRVATERTTFADAFRMADEVLHSGVRGVTDLMVKPGLVNLDFADIRAIMREMGKAMMGTGEATGDRRALEAAEAAISNPLLDDVSLKGARAVLINITGGLDMTLYEVDEAANRIREEVDPEANIIFGSAFNESMNGLMRVSVVATGIDAPSMALRPLHAASGQGSMPGPGGMPGGIGSAGTAPLPADPKKPFNFSLAPRVEVPRMAKPVAPAPKESVQQPAPATVSEPAPRSHESANFAPPPVVQAPPVSAPPAAFQPPRPQTGGMPFFAAAAKPAQTQPATPVVSAPPAQAFTGPVFAGDDMATTIGAAMHEDTVPELRMASPKRSVTAETGGLRGVLAGGGGAQRPVAEQHVPDMKTQGMPLFQHAASDAPAPVSPRSERRAQPAEPKEDSVFSFFQKMAGMRKVLSARVEQAERMVQVSERPRGEAPRPTAASQRPADEEDYLEIPAFLRRQAN